MPSPLATRSFLLAASTLVLGCAPGVSVRTDERTTHPDAEPIAPFTECTVYTAREPAVSTAHAEPCSALEYPFHPPASGRHYSRWASFRTYSEPVPWGFLVHSMEHGAVVLAHHCEGDCSAVTAAFQAIIDEQGLDPLCRAEDSPSRFVVVPDPELEWAIAAVAWERVYLATCLDMESLRAFVDEVYGHGRESLCAPGEDRETTGWCS